MTALGKAHKTLSVMSTAVDIITMCTISTARDVTERICAVLYLSIWVLHVVFNNIYCNFNQNPFRGLFKLALLG